MAIYTRKPTSLPKNLVFYVDADSTKNNLLDEVEVLVVGGGGGGGHQVGGGGGGGGVVYASSYPVTPGTGVAVVVGNGGNGSTSTGASASNGQNSSFGSMTAIGGGAGQIHQSNGIGANGGSGGGGAGSNSGANGYGTNGEGGQGTFGQGNRGGRGRGNTAINFSGDGWAGGGGGGAGAPGEDALNNTEGGKGGDGLPFNISGTLRYYGGGGGGCEGSSNVSRSKGGLGGGGAGKGNIATLSEIDGVPNTGGGGGGVRDPSTRAGNGGSGVVIIRYPGPQKATGGNNITRLNGYTIHTFTTSGTFTPTTTFNGIQDLTNNGNDLIASNITYTTSGVKYWTFNGTSSWAYRTSNLNHILQDKNTATVIAWIRPGAQNSGTYNGIFAYGPKSCNGRSLLFSMASDRRLTMAKWCDDSTNTSGAMAAPQSTWSMVSLVKDGVLTRFGLNGVYETTANTGSNAFYSGVITLGSTDNPGRFYSGDIALVQLYNTALSDSDITNIYNASRSRFGV